MKCPYCGAEVGLEEKFCSFCGSPNDQAARHHQDMAQYQKRYAETEAAVVSKTESFSRIVPRAIVVLVLLIASVAMFVISEYALFFPENMRRRSAEKQAEQTCAVLDAYLEDRDYLSFSSYCSYYGILTYNSPFEEYRNVIWASGYYKDFVIRLESLFLHNDRDTWLKYSASDDVRWLVDSLDSFLESVEDSKSRGLTERDLTCLEDMQANVENMLRVFLGVEDTESFLSLSDSRKMVYIEEVILHAGE